MNKSDLLLTAFATVAALSAPLAWSQSTPVPTTVVQAKSVGASYDLDGVIQAVKQSTIAAQASGRIVTMAVKAGDKVSFGEVELDVLHCPGHTPGHLVFFHPASRLAQVGDVLFQGSIGRTDFPRGDYDTLIRSIHERLFPLGDDVSFIPGHGSMSTLGEERRYNPFLSGKYG